MPQRIPLWPSSNHSPSHSSHPPIARSSWNQRAFSTWNPSPPFYAGSQVLRTLEFPAQVSPSLHPGPTQTSTPHPAPMGRLSNQSVCSEAQGVTSGGGLLTWNVDKIWTYSTVRGEAERGTHTHTRPRDRTESGYRLRTSESALCVLQNPTLEPNHPDSYKGIFVR